MKPHHPSRIAFVTVSLLLMVAPAASQTAPTNAPPAAKAAAGPEAIQKRTLPSLEIRERTTKKPASAKGDDGPAQAAGEIDADAYKKAARAFEALTEDEKLAQQAWLTLSDTYDAPFATSFTPELYGAIIDYQILTGWPASGILDREQQDELIRGHGKLRHLFYGFKIEPAPGKRASIWIPARLVREVKDAGSSTGGKFWLAEDDSLVIALTRFRIDMAELEKSMAKIITETGNVITSERRHRDRVEILSQDAEGNFDFFAVHRDGDNTMVLRIQWSREGGESAARLAPLISNSLALSLKGKALALPDLSQEGTWDSFVEAAEAFSKLTREDVIAHQLSLAATGHLKEGYGAEFDYHTFQAARSFQAFNNYPATGLLSERQRELLKKEADILLHSWALKEVTPEGLGATLYVPEGLDLQTSSTGAEHAWTSHTTGFQVTATRYPSTDVAATHAQTVQDANELGATITLNRLKTEQSQLRLRLPKDREFDLRFHQLGSEVLALEVTWDPDKGYYRPQALAALIGQLFEDNLPAGSSTVPDPSTETPEQTDMRQATAEPQSEPAPEKVPSRLATGLFVSGEGHVLTSARHVSGCSSIEVTAQLGASSQASVVARDSTNDFVLLRTSFKSAVHANFRNALRVGEGVLGLGYPETGFAVGRGDVLLGNVTALTGPASDSRFARISLAVGPSHAGGPLMDMKGQVLGILVPGSEALATMASEAGDIPETASYAVKSSLITGFLESNRIPVTRSKEAEEMPVAALSLRANAISATVACVK